MAKVIGILNEKGGTGKTASATALACLLARSGKRVALIDFDGQGHSSIICGVKNPNKLEVTISTLLNCIITDQPLPDLEKYVVHNKNGVDLIPANSELFVLERNLCNVDFRERILSRYIDTIKNQYDYIIFDTMPQIGTPMINVMMCSDSIIIPTQSELLSAQGLSQLLKHYQSIRKNSNHQLKIEGILITMDSANTIVSGQVRSMIENSYSGKVPIFNTRIPRSIKVVEACLYQQTICEYMSNNPAAIAYENLLKEMMNNAQNA